MPNYTAKGCEPRGFYIMRGDEMTEKDTQLVAGLASDLNRELGAWQPIETAPKDGSMVLLSDGTYVDAGFYHDGSGCYGHRGGAGFFCEEDRGNLLTASNFQATHWMPLPPPPSES